MRKQRYQRYVAKNQDPERVNESTLDQDMQFLNTQIKALKNIWKEDEEEPIKKGDSHSALDQDIKDIENKLINVSQDSDKLSPEDKEELSAKLKGKSPLEIALNGNKVNIADTFKDDLVKKYGEEEVNNYIVYSNKNQPVVNKTARFESYFKSIPADKYNDDFLSSQNINPTDFVSETRLKQLQVDKYTDQAKSFIDSVKLTDANAKIVTEKLAEKIDSSNLPDKKRVELESYLANKLTKQQLQKEKLAKATSEKIKSDYLNGNVYSISNFELVTDNDAKSIGNVQFERKAQSVDEGRITWANFKQIPSDIRIADVHKAKYDKKVSNEYREIERFTSDSDNIFGFKAPTNIPVNKEMTVELTYNYFNEQKRRNPDFTLEDARSALFSQTGVRPEGQNIHAQALLADTHRFIYTMGLDEKQYINLFKTEAGRQKILDLFVEKSRHNSYLLDNFNSMDLDNGNTRQRGEQPKTN